MRTVHAVIPFSCPRTHTDTHCDDSCVRTDSKYLPIHTACSLLTLTRNLTTAAAIRSDSCFHSFPERMAGNSCSVRIVILGGGGVGKTAIVKRFLFHTFTEKYRPTVEDLFFKEFNYGTILLKVSV